MWIFREIDGTLFLSKDCPNLDLYGNFEYYGMEELLPLPSSWFPEVKEGFFYNIDFSQNSGVYNVYIARDSNMDCYVHVNEPSKYQYGKYECYISNNSLYLGKHDFPEIKPLSGAFKYEIYIPNHRRKIKKMYGTV